MKKIIMILLSFITTTLLVVGCSSSKDIQDFNIDKIALDEAKKITSEQGYTLKSETLSDILIGDSEVFTLIKEASIKGGYLKEDLDSMTEDRKVVGYELAEKSILFILIARIHHEILPSGFVKLLDLARKFLLLNFRESHFE